MGCIRVTDEPAQDRENSRRKFDDVASLFGTIVPPTGGFRSPPGDYHVPFPPRNSPSPVPTEPPAVARAVLEPEPIPERSLERTAPPRPHPTEVPWPDAFEPRPNFHRREPRNWSWLLLIPVGFVAAVGITMLDPRTIRDWLDTNVLHRTSVPATITAPLLSTPPEPAPPAEVPTPYPALPTSPVPIPPGTEVSPPPIDPAAAAAAAAVPLRSTLQFRRNIPGSAGEARRIAALLQSYGGSIELHPNATTARVPTISYYNTADKTAATDLAVALANEAISWTVHAGTAKNPPGSLDVWLP